MQNLTSRTKAKLNLCLHVEGRTEGGYHKLQSIVAFCDIGDLLEIAPSDELSLKVVGEFADDIPFFDENIILKAAIALQKSTAKTSGAHIILHKNLPPSSGIGGGSGDAALALQLLNQLWNCGLNGAQLQHIGLKIGADVPVCLHGKLCLMAGIGEVISPLPFACNGLYAVLINPLISIATADIFAQLTAADYSGALQYHDDLLQTLHHNHNDLQNIATEICPVIATIISYLEAQPQTLLARMSGSGATCFALCANAADASKLQQNARHYFHNYWVAAGAIS